MESLRVQGLGQAPVRRLELSKSCLDLPPWAPHASSGRKSGARFPQGSSIAHVAGMDLGNPQLSIEKPK